MVFVVIGCVCVSPSAIFAHFLSLSDVVRFSAIDVTHKQHRLFSTRHYKPDLPEMDLNDTGPSYNADSKFVRMVNCCLVRHSMAIVYILRDGYIQSFFCRKTYLKCIINWTGDFRRAFSTKTTTLQEKSMISIVL